MKPIFATEDEFGPLLARLSILYEDLRIELRGATDAVLDRLDGNSPKYRKLYFLRRSTITLIEFSGTLQRLGQTKTFKTLRSRFDKEAERRWSSAVSFFGQHHKLLKSVRNDCGGHFQLATAKTLVRQLNDDTTAMMTVDYGPTGDDVTVYMKFASEFAGGSLAVRLPEGDDLRVFVPHLFDVVTGGWEHVVKIMHVLARAVLIPKFGL